MIKSILEQEYTNYRVVYFRDPSAGKSIERYMNENALDPKKVKIIENTQGKGYLSDFLEGKAHCTNDELAIFLSDEDRIIGYQAFATVSSLFSHNKNVPFLLYTASLNSDLSLGKSFPYPLEVSKNGSFNNYPFLLGGLIAFSYDLY